MTHDLANWERNWALMEYFFDPNEVAAIKQKLSTLEIRQVVYCSFESRFARSGGLGAVSAKILPWLNEVKDIQKVYLLSPYYPSIIAENKPEKTDKSFEMDYDGKTVHIDIYKYTLHYTRPVDGALEEYYLKARDFFNTRGNNPYLYDADPQRNDELIRENALFFCKAVPLALKALGIKENIVFHLQEWQTALIALTAKEAMLNGTLTSCAAVQTIHNPFDSWLSLEMLKKIVSPERIYNPRIQEKPEFWDKFYNKSLTAYQVGLQLVDGPITTVSQHFAKELTTDILQVRYYAPHLQEIFKKTGVTGINNGLFQDFPLEFSRHDRYPVEEIRRIKQEKRTALLRILSRYHPKSRFGDLTYRGGSIIRLPEDIPIFTMSGRLDAYQKGFDILLRAIENFAEDQVKVVLTPIPVRDSDLDYFYEVACKCRGNITVFPMLMEKGFQELQMGAAYGIMPSIYEPFGAAVEYMVNGTVTIARAVGGLKDQVIHGLNGLLYREEDNVYNPENIENFTATGDMVQMRKMNPWVQAMANALHLIMQEAVEIYRNQQYLYYRMIAEGLQQARNFDWQVSATEYVKIYQRIHVSTNKNK
jgi:glycogen synthase